MAYFLRYTYPEGNRISQTDSSSNGTTHYLIDTVSALPRMLSRTLPDGTTTHYIYGVGLAYQINSDGSTHTYHYAHLGNTIAITNDQGEVTDRVDEAWQCVDGRLRSNRLKGEKNGYLIGNSLNQYNPYGIITYREGTTVTIGTSPDELERAQRDGNFFSHTLTLRDGTSDPTASFFTDSIDIYTVLRDGWQESDGTILGDSIDHQQHSAYLPPATESFTYDARGNLLSDSRWDYTWDAENRLIFIQTQSTALQAGISPKKFGYRYDYQGRRYAKDTYIWNGTSYPIHPSKTTLYYYDGWNLIYEARYANITYNGDTPTSATFDGDSTYYWGLDWSTTLDGAGGTGGLLAIATRNDGEAPTYRYPSYDGNGNLVALTDSQGTLTATYEYGPYGEAWRATGPDAPLNPFRFSTQYHDPETRHYYYGYRYYSPDYGRFLSQDPIDETGGLNLYAFVNNNPYNLNDYLGLAWYNPFSWFGGDDTSSDSLGSTQMETFYDSEGSYQYYETDPVTPSSGSDGFWNGIGNFFGGFFNSSNDTSSDNQAVGWVSQIHQRHALLEDFGVAPSSERLQAGRDLGQSIVTGTELLADLTGVNTATILGSGQTVTGQDPTALDALAVIPPLRVGKYANVAKAGNKLDDKIAMTFKNNKYKSKVLKQNVTAYRFSGGKSGQKGNFLTTKQTISQIKSPKEAILALELPSTATAKELNEFIIPKGTTIYYGRISGSSNNSTQIYILDSTVLKAKP